MQYDGIILLQSRQRLMRDSAASPSQDGSRFRVPIGLLSGQPAVVLEVLDSGGRVDMPWGICRLATRALIDRHGRVSSYVTSDIGAM